MMNGNEKSGNVVTADTYRDVIAELIGKVKPEYLKRIYKIVNYFYIKK